MDLVHTIDESELYNHISKFNFPLESGNLEFKSILQSSWTSSSKLLQKKQETILELRNYSAKLNLYYDELKNLKKEEALLMSHKPTDESKVAEAQIFFQGEHTKFLNFIPYVLAVCVFLKVWIAPVMALLSPFLLAIMPYIIMTQIMDMPITWDMYTVLMKQMVFGIQNGEPWRLKHYGQAAWTLVSIGQGIVQPFITSYHTSNLDNEITKRGNALIKIHKTIKTIINLCPLFESIYIPEIPSDAREAAAWIDQEPLGMKSIWRAVGRICVYVQLARDVRWNPVQWTSSSSLQITNMHDLAIIGESAVKSNCCLKGHALLTGPNRGGKSSNLRAILQQIVLGQTTGFTFGSQGSWKPFRFVFTRLKSRDTAGKESLFEMEVRFASNIINTIKSQNYHTLVLIDELFHSTNPPDAETSAKMFLDLLWKYSHVKSIISTHIFSLCEKKHPTPIQTFYCNAEEQENGKLRYDYALQEGGVCRTSSVREVLLEFGLCA